MTSPSRDLARPASGTARRVRDRHFQRHRRRDLHHARRRRRDAAEQRGDAGGVGARRRAGVCRRAGVRRAGGVAAAGRRRVRLPARELRRPGRVSDRLDVVRRRFQRRDRVRARSPSPAIWIGSSRAPATRRSSRAGRSVRSALVVSTRALVAIADHRRAGAGPGARRRPGPPGPELADRRSPSARWWRSWSPGLIVAPSPQAAAARQPPRAGQRLADRAGAGDVQLHRLERRGLRRRGSAQPDAKRAARARARHRQRHRALPGVERAVSPRRAAGGADRRDRRRRDGGRPAVRIGGGGDVRRRGDPDHPEQLERVDAGGSAHLFRDGARRRVLRLGRPRAPAATGRRRSRFSRRRCGARCSCCRARSSSC